eukprot:TRINITY_DN62342_c0_g1_i1.p1 TRINITY_DN62342_c0_g1~~TRINITY_DN62342_c0_g1_i1.p1  ORF type:complete len:430 (-),score=61.32 TRINITY_DN62342_c0_g1_i1:72-1361(-)
MPSSGTASGTGCDLICILCCALSIFICGYIAWQNYANLPGQVQASKLWAHPQNGAEWVEGTCKVLRTGIASQGGCWEPAPKQQMNIWQTELNRDPDLPAEFSVCPGLHWCADEGGTCEKCEGGDVLYAGTLFHGNMPIDHTAAGESVRETLLQAKHPTGKGTMLHNVNGPVQCSHGDGAQFPEDPMPGQRKSCFCTPKEVVDLVKEKGPIHPDGESGQTCQGIANQAFTSETKSRRLREMISQEALNTTSQLWMYPEGYCRPEDVSNILVSDMYSFNTGYWVYLNWALVEVKNPGEPEQPKLRCASEFGAPFASREDNDWVKEIYKKYRSYADSETTIPCYIRKGGMCGDSSCAVALTNPSELYEKPPPFGPILPVVLMILGCCPFCLLCAFCAAVATSRIDQQNESSQLLGQQSDAEPTPAPSAARGM